MNLDLSGKNALVGGSSKGIGKAIAIELAQLGANVTLMARSEDLLKEVVKELDTSKGQKHHYLVVDFAQPDELKNKVERLISERGAIHILINNTGGPAGGPALDAEIEEFKQAFSNHLICNQILTQVVVPGMKAEEYGRIINVISTSVKQPIPGLGVSNTIRGAVGNWSKTLAGELGPFGITVNNVLPGATSTERLSEIVDAKAQKLSKSTEDIEQFMRSSIPARRFAAPEEVAAAAAFLASPAAAYVNGINLPVDGGRTSSL